MASETFRAKSGEGALTITTTCADAGGATIACSTATGGAGPGNTVTVTVERPFSFFTPLINGFFGGDLTVANSASAVVLGYVPSASATQPPVCSTPPTAAFVVVNTTGLEVFANPTASTPDSGICNISGYNWDWGDGTSSVGTAIGDYHTYPGTGTYSITLEVSNQAGYDPSIHSATVPYVAPTPIAVTDPRTDTDTRPDTHADDRSYTHPDTHADADTCRVRQAGRQLHVDELRKDVHLHGHVDCRQSCPVPDHRLGVDLRRQGQPEVQCPEPGTRDVPGTTARTR